jgi:predicted GNAT superfamily acetyltransferase
MSEAADAAARRAGVTTRLLGGHAELRAASDLLCDIWSRPRSEPILPVDLQRALLLTGNYVAGAFAGEELVGACAGHYGRGEELYLWSIVAGARDHSRGVGFALKQHQRAWAIEHELALVVWTFDPLVRRNGWFNLTKLGALGTRYHVDLWGPLDDGFNRGDETDRVLVSWRVRDPRAAQAAGGAYEQHDVDPASGEVVLDEGAGGEPVVREVATDAGTTLFARVPEDIEAVRATDPGRAHAWRRAGRDTIGRALDAGYAATGVTRSGFYVLEPRRP